MVRKRRLIAGIALAAGSLAGALLLRQRGTRSERVDLYLGDGTLQTLEASEPASARLLELARAIVSDASPATE
ncbi:MAG: hypothetical protein ACXVYM_02660 [Gaiellaceae bacterium]